MVHSVNDILLWVITCDLLAGCFFGCKRQKLRQNDVRSYESFCFLWHHEFLWNLEDAGGYSACIEVMIDIPMGETTKWQCRACATNGRSTDPSQPFNLCRVIRLRRHSIVVKGSLRKHNVDLNEPTPRNLQHLVANALFFQFFLHPEIDVMGNSHCPLRLWWVMIFHCHFTGQKDGHSSCNGKLEVVESQNSRKLQVPGLDTSDLCWPTYIYIILYSYVILYYIIYYIILYIILYYILYYIILYHYIYVCILYMSHWSNILWSSYQAKAPFEAIKWLHSAATLPPTSKTHGKSQEYHGKSLEHHPNPTCFHWKIMFINMFLLNKHGKSPQ